MSIHDFKQEPWTPIHEPVHRDPYQEFVKGPYETTTGEIIRKACVYGCGHCNVTTRTREELKNFICK